VVIDSYSSDFVCNIAKNTILIAIICAHEKCQPLKIKQLIFVSGTYLPDIIVIPNIPPIKAIIFQKSPEINSLKSIKRRIADNIAAIIINLL